MALAALLDDSCPTLLVAVMFRPLARMHPRKPRQRPRPKEKWSSPYFWVELEWASSSTPRQGSEHMDPLVDRPVCRADQHDGKQVRGEIHGRLAAARAAYRSDAVRATVDAGDLVRGHHCDQRDHPERDDQLEDRSGFRPNDRSAQLIFRAATKRSRRASRPLNREPSSTATLRLRPRSSSTSRA